MPQFFTTVEIKQSSGELREEIKKLRLAAEDVKKQHVNFSQQRDFSDHLAQITEEIGGDVSEPRDVGKASFEDLSIMADDFLEAANKMLEISSPKDITARLDEPEPTKARLLFLRVCRNCLTRLCDQVADTTVAPSSHAATTAPADDDDADALSFYW